MPEAFRTRLSLPPDDALPAAQFELNSTTDAMSAFEQICLAIPASGVIIAVRDASGLRSVGSLGDAPEVGSHLPPDFGMAIECLETRSAVFRDFTDDAQRVLYVGMTMEGVSQVRSAVTLPMHASGAIIGLIAVFSRRDSSIQPRDIKDLTLVADFWGPLMADEWFPDGIPSAIVEEAAENAAVNSTAAETPIVEALPTKESTIEQSEIIDGAAVAENTPTAPMEREESVATAAERIDPSALPAQHLSVESLTFARATGKPTSPIFLAPAEPIPAEAFHSGEPQSFIWFIMLLVFASCSFLYSSFDLTGNNPTQPSQTRRLHQSPSPQARRAPPTQVQSPLHRLPPQPQNNLPRPPLTIPPQPPKLSRPTKNCPSRFPT